jgi:hypothetical protein
MASGLSSKAIITQMSCHPEAMAVGGTSCVSTLVVNRVIEFESNIQYSFSSGILCQLINGFQRSLVSASSSSPLTQYQILNSIH